MIALGFLEEGVPKLGGPQCSSQEKPGQEDQGEGVTGNRKHITDRGMAERGAQPVWGSVKLQGPEMSHPVHTSLVQAAVAPAGSMKAASRLASWLAPLPLYSFPFLSASRTSPTSASDQVAPQSTHRCPGPLLTYRVIAKLISLVQRTFQFDPNLLQPPNLPLVQDPRSQPLWAAPHSTASPCSPVAIPMHRPCPLPGIPSCLLPCICLLKSFPWAPCLAFAGLPTLIWKFSIQTPLGILPVLI